MTSNALADFLASLAADADKLENFNTSESNARTLMTQAGLSAAQQDAIVSHDVATIHKQLDPDGNWTSEFAVPAGPTKAPPLPTKKFRIIPDGDQEFTGLRTTQRAKPSGTRTIGSRPRPARGSTKRKSTKSKATGKKTSAQRRRKSTKKGR
jgi:hypothetical protein